MTFYHIVLDLEFVYLLPRKRTTEFEMFDTRISSLLWMKNTVEL